MDLNQILLWEEILRNVDDAEELFNIQRNILVQSDPFLLSDKKFVKLFRLTKPVCQQLINTLEPFIAEPTRRSAISKETKILTALRFFGFGSYQEITGSNHYVALSQSSVSRCVKEVCEALNNPLVFNEWVHFPRNLQEMQNLRTRFFEKYQFPGVVGCFDCTHVGIIAPSINNPLFPEHVYVNRKNYHSINVQLICDGDMIIRNVNAQFPGSTHDANIWRQSQVSRVMEAIYRRDPRNPFFLIGDAGYPTRPWLLTSLPNPAPGVQQRFNARFCSRRALSERCNGVLKNRFRCLLKYRILHYSPTIASKIINSCVVLHNMCIANNIPEPEIDGDDDVDYGIYVVEGLQEPVGRVDPDLAAARRLQENIMYNYI